MSQPLAGLLKLRRIDEVETRQTLARHNHPQLAPAFTESAKQERRAARLRPATSNALRQNASQRPPLNDAVAVWTQNLVPRQRQNELDEGSMEKRITLVRDRDETRNRSGVHDRPIL
jgi:hypothetical protein